MMSTTEREVINETKTFVHAQLVSLPFEHEKVTPVSKVSFLEKKNLVARTNYFYHCTIFVKVYPVSSSTGRKTERWYTRNFHLKSSLAYGWSA